MPVSSDLQHYLS